MLIYKTSWFDHWAKKQSLTNQAHCQAVQEMQTGLYEAYLGEGLFKKRIAKQGQGKRGSFRTLIATNKSDQWFLYLVLKKTPSAILVKKNKPH
jgi:hypothetical protein